MKCCSILYLTIFRSIKIQTQSLSFIIFSVSVFFCYPSFSQTVDEIKSLQRKTATQRANCEKQKCPELLVLRQYESVLKRFAESVNLSSGLKAENSNLKKQTEILGGKTQLPPKGSCYKKELLETLMLENGIYENGGTLYSKQPMAIEDSRCWTNARKKREATLTLCEFPLAINILTKGGEPTHPVTRKREYIFDLNGCDLLTVHIADQDSKIPKETSLSYTTCVENWNKRTADAAMIEKQIELMENTIAFCFREHLLPPRRSKTGRKNPEIKDQPEIQKQKK